MAEALLFERDVAMPMRDGAVLRANVYRPRSSDRSLVIMTVGPYGKDVPFADRNPDAYARIAEYGPSLNWETPNPEWWVPRGYVVIRVDQRGIGSSAGRLDLSPSSRGRTFTMPSSGRPRSHGVPETWACWASPTMHSRSGKSPPCSHPT